MKSNLKNVLVALILVFSIVFSFSACVKCGPDPDVIDTGYLDAFDYSAIPEYSGNEYVTVNKNTPFFSDGDKVTYSYERYAECDSLGRCTIAIASIGQDMMPTEERESISSVKPTGWVQASYDFISGKYLYNRCHLIAFQLTGENAREENLITGTRYMNEAMIPFENMVAAYVKETNNHVMYRATPIFIENELVARGVLVEAFSVEDEGDGICFNVFFYNVQPGVIINYATGDSYADGQTPPDNSKGDYIINKNNGKIHKATCSYALKIAEQNRLYSSEELNDLIDDGYVKAGCCLGD